MGTFSYLGKENEKLINMYSVARQFRNTISPSEMLLIKKHTVINRVFPYIVNCSFSCEVYLKTIILLNGLTIPKKHNLISLLNISGLNDGFKSFVMEKATRNNEGYSEKRFERDLKSISNSFVDWRYIYEKTNITVSNGFLQLFNDYLDKECKALIYDKFNVDMNKYPCI